MGLDCRDPAAPGACGCCHLQPTCTSFHAFYVAFFLPFFSFRPPYTFYSLIDMTDNDDTLYKELVGFLKSDRVDLQEAATDAVLLLASDNLYKIVQYGAMDPLSKFMSTPGKRGLNALHALVNVTASEKSLALLQEEEDAFKSIILRSVEVALSGEEQQSSNARINCALSLLANITRTEKGAVQFLSLTSSPQEGEEEEESIRKERVNTANKQSMKLLLLRFIGSSSTKNKNAEDAYQHVASVLLNITQIESGRRFVMRQQKQHRTSSSSSSTILESILPQLRSRNRIRRHGVAGTIKNCCFDSESAYWLLNQVGILTHLLYPLAGPEELEMEEKVGMDPELWLEGPDKVREPCPATRLLLVDAILLLCASGRQSRNYLRTHRAYVIIKMADMVEDNEKVGDKIEQVVQFLRRDEHGEEDGSSDRLVDQEWKQNLLVSSTSMPLHSIEENFDDVD